jgi:D-alanine--poly(phosphoribitol) ligase subunit 2
VSGAPVTTRAVQQLIAARLAVPEPGPDDDLVDSSLIDSLALVELLFELESTFGVELPLEELEIDDFRTPERIAALVARLEAAA